jgi:hypothetical protein
MTPPHELVQLLMQFMATAPAAQQNGATATA